MMCNDKQKLNWGELKEEAHSTRPIRFSIFLVKILPHFILALIAFPVSFFYLIFSKRARTFSLQYQKNLISFSNKNALKNANPYKHILSFALCLVEKIEGWSGKSSLDNLSFEKDDYNDFVNLLNDGKGAMLIGSHLGNIELLRCLASYNKTGANRNIPVSVIMEINVTSNFNKAIAELNPKSSVDIITPEDIGIDTISVLQERIEQGGLVVIAADRVPLHSEGRTIEMSFLGKNCKFPFGPYLIASLLKCPVYFMFALRKKDISLRSKYVMYINKSKINFNCSRKERDSKIKEMALEFRNLLEEFCIKYPYQWYNFYDFFLE